MRELFAKWARDKNTNCNQMGVTRDTGVTSLKYIKIGSNPNENCRVTGVTKDPVEEAGSTIVTHVTHPDGPGIQLNSNNTNPVTLVSRVTREMIESLPEIELEAWDERAAILEFDAGLSRFDAEEKAMSMILNESNNPCTT